MTCGCGTTHREARLRDISFRINHANTVAPITGVSPILLTNAVIHQTALGGTSFVHTFSLRVNSCICIRGNNRVVPGVITISARTETTRTIPIIFPRYYPRYNAPLMHCRNRTTRCYPGSASYPPRHGKGVRRFISQQTVGVVNLKGRLVSSCCRHNLVHSITSLCSLQVRRL